MAGPSWLVDGRRIATKIKSASETHDPKNVQWKSNPTKACPNCHHVIDNSDVGQEWPGLPKGVKFDPSDEELLWHLLAKAGVTGAEPHPFIDEFISTVNRSEGIYYTHPQNLPGVRQDGSASHFFHRTAKAYNSGTRKRRKINGNDTRDIRWHKTGKTKPVSIDGIQSGCKKIMVLYMNLKKGEKLEKTNWVMHQYHLGTDEDEKDGEYVVSKVFYQQQAKQNDKNAQGSPCDAAAEAAVMKVYPLNSKWVTPCDAAAEALAIKVDPVTFKSATPEPTPPENNRRDPVLSRDATASDELSAQVIVHDERNAEDNCIQSECNDDKNHTLELKWSQGDSLNLLDSQQLAEGLSICDELLQSQSPSGDIRQERKGFPLLADYAHLGPESLKKDLEECQKSVHYDPANIELDTPPEFRLSQLEFESQDSFLNWGGKLEDFTDG